MRKGVGGLFKVQVACLVILMAMASCTSIDCSVDSLVRCVYGFRDSSGKSVTLGNPISVSSHRSIDGSDTLLINKQAQAKQLSLPMSYGLVADTLFLTVEDSISKTMDRIIVEKTNEPVFESVDCNPRYNHTITKISSTHNFIDTLVVNKAFVSGDASQENILIYIRTSD